MTGIATHAKEPVFEATAFEIRFKFSMDMIHEKDWNINGELIISSGFDSDEIDTVFSNVDVLLQPSQCMESFGLTVR